LDHRLQTNPTPTKADREQKNSHRPQRHRPQRQHDDSDDSSDARIKGDAMSRRGSKRKDTLPALPPGGLRVVPLGGIGEIGRNMTVFEHAGRLLVVDCGVCSPKSTSPVST
jgi:Predicted hydrolase of the metallo-beta-lactamase superfamily